jgi:hypothetical protein
MSSDALSSVFAVVFVLAFFALFVAISKFYTSTGCRLNIRWKSAQHKEVIPLK